jgi:glutamine phosphoribosylpyrophosphate amidotransferase
MSVLVEKGSQEYSEAHDLTEKCGLGLVVGEDAPTIARDVIVRQKNRGQDSAGESVYIGNRSVTESIETRVGLGFVPLVLNDTFVAALGESNLAITHARFATNGEGAQPRDEKNGAYHLSLAHNGEIPTVEQWYHNSRVFPNATSDSAKLAAYLAEQRSYHTNWQETFKKALADVDGAYSLVCLTEE